MQHSVTVGVTLVQLNQLSRGLVLLKTFSARRKSCNMEFDFLPSVVPLVVIVAVATVALTSVMTPSTVFMMVLPSMIVFSVIAFFFGMKYGEFNASP